MIQAYVQAVLAALNGVLVLLKQVSLPLAVCLGLVIVAAAVVRAWGPPSLQPMPTGRVLARVGGYACVGVLTVCGWAVLRMTLPVARQAQAWEASAEATASTKSDAPPVQQYGPTVAVVAEHTYTRTLTLPPDFLQRLGTDGVGVLSPYLSDPSADNVLRLRDTFRRSGQDVLFTRDLTRRDEEPLPFDSARISVAFRRTRAARGYDVLFEGHYFWSNVQAAPVNARFLFTPPNAGAVRDLSVSVGGQTMADAGTSGAYEWNGTVGPGEKREAVVRYRVSGTRTWRYDLGSQRRRVRQFFLEAKTDGPVRFLRGSLEPTEQNGNTVRWQLNDLITSQEVAIALTPDIAAQEGYLQALSALPASLLLFVVGTLSLGVWWRRNVEPGMLAAAVLVCLLGLGAVPILTNYVGPVAGVLIGPLLAGALALRLLGPWSLLSVVPAVLLPSVFLSPRHSGLLVLVLALLTIAGLWRGAAVRLREQTPRTTE